MENRLKELRKKENSSLKKLKKILKEEYNVTVSDSQLLYYENGSRKPRNEKIWSSLAHHFGVSVPYLLGYDNPPKLLLDELEEQKDKYLSETEKKDLENNPEKKDFYLDVVRDRLLEIQRKDVENTVQAFDKDFINLLKEYSIYLSDNQIEQIKELMRSMSDVNNKYLTTAMAGGYFSELKIAKDYDFKQLFEYSQIWKENYSAMEYNDKNNLN